MGTGEVVSALDVHVRMCVHVCVCVFKGRKMRVSRQQEESSVTAVAVTSLQGD